MTQQPHHSEHPVFMYSPAQTVMYVQRTFKKYGNKNSHVIFTLINTWHMCSRWYTSDLNVVTTTIWAFAPQW